MASAQPYAGSRTSARTAANGLSLSLRCRPYRIVTDSYGSYRSLLRDSAFGDRRSFSPSGGYQAARSWIDLAGKSALRGTVDAYLESRTSKDLTSILSAAGAMRLRIPHFGLAARKLNSSLD